MFNNKYFVLTALVAELVTLELVLIYGGSYFDKQMSWPGYGVMLGAVLGFGVWVFHLVVVLKKLETEDEQ